MISDYFAPDREGCRIWAEVDLGQIRRNALAARARLDGKPGMKLLCVVKANAYGHGAVPVAKALDGIADFFAVATAEEALELADAGIGPVLILGHVPASRFPQLIRAGVRLTADTAAELRAINHAAEAAGVNAVVHLAVDTGMTRIGVTPDGDGLAVARTAASLKNVTLEGMFTHMARADETDKSAALAQLAKLASFRELLRENGIEVPLVHGENSAGIAELEPVFDMARYGILLYGLRPSDEVTGDGMNVSPAMSLYARAVRVREVPAGVPVSYGGTFVTTRKTRIATVSAGYADGVDRGLSGKGAVLHGGKRLPILGRVCMDMMMVDATDDPTLAPGDAVTLLGRSGDEVITADGNAALCGTIGYELVCAVSARVPRFYKE